MSMSRLAQIIGQTEPPVPPRHLVRFNVDDWDHKETVPPTWWTGGAGRWRWTEARINFVCERERWLNEHGRTPEAIYALHRPESHRRATSPRPARPTRRSGPIVQARSATAAQPVDRDTIMARVNRIADELGTPSRDKQPHRISHKPQLPTGHGYVPSFVSEPRYGGPSPRLEVLRRLGGR